MTVEVSPGEGELGTGSVIYHEPSTQNAGNKMFGKFKSLYKLCNYYSFDLSEHCPSRVTSRPN